jgi:hypothetical protein
MNTDLIKLLADTGGIGVALVLIVAGYKLAAACVPKFMDMVSNHFEENAKALQALTDAVSELISYLKNQNHQ